MSFNHVVRSVGFSIGGALGGLVLAVQGARLSTESGYTAATWAGAVPVTISLVLRAEARRR